MANGIARARLKNNRQETDITEWGLPIKISSIIMFYVC